MELILNPADFDSTYLACLNSCFPGWGTERDFSWAFRRPTFPRADIFVLHDQGTILAGSALTYRRWRKPDGSHLASATMTGSWTLPVARRRGCFTRIIETSLQIARDRGCAVLNAYVRSENPSAGRLAAAGATLLPATYLKVSANMEASATCRMEEISSLEAWRARMPARGCLHYDYDQAEWLDQFANRPSAVTFLRLDGNSIAAVEARETSDYLLELTPTDPDIHVSAMQALHARSSVLGRTFAAYSVAPWAATRLAKFGFQAAPGAMMSLATGSEMPDGFARRSAIWISNGDRM